MKLTGHTFDRGQLGGSHRDDPRFKKFIALSVGVHVVLLVAAGTMTMFRLSGESYSPSYTVDLVSIPGPPAATSKPAARAPAPAVKKPEKKAEKAPVKKAAAEKPVALPRDNKAEPVPYEGDEAARSDRQKRLDDLERKAQELFEQFSVRDAVPAAGSQAETADETESDSPATIGVPGGSGGGQAGRPSNLMYRAYYDRIYAHIYAVWNPPKSVSKDSKIVTVVGVVISPNGSIEQHWIEKKSGNIYYDESVLRALSAANPLPPIPAELGNDTMEVGLKFLPSDR
jgi:TonB family protein